ncbi:MAG: hypothetical protein OQK50_04245 [Deltaproteobacteria bacterium]|jgi:hypothetical protein|nr:hypothetical protein [Deltaproteobacteria bacterium]MCW9049525.1 hypothetical protein [Deltaproteobacteria bacterium]
MFTRAQRLPECGIPIRRRGQRWKQQAAQQQQTEIAGSPEQATKTL